MMSTLFLREHNRIADRISRAVIEHYINHITPIKFPLFAEPGIGGRSGTGRTGCPSSSTCCTAPSPRRSPIRCLLPASTVRTRFPEAVQEIDPTRKLSDTVRHNIDGESITPRVSLGLEQ